MSRITFEHGGKEYDDQYPKGIPTTLDITLSTGEKLTSGLVLFPAGHANNKKAKLRDILKNKFN
jgi:2-methylcitrate dehydratase